MGLDRQVAAILELGAKAGRPPYETLSPAQARRQYVETRMALQPPPAPVASVKDVAVAGAGGPLMLRFYRPQGAAPNALLPALVFFHGGGWVLGDLESHDALCRQLANDSQVAVVAVGYRLAPEHKFPAAFEDALLATRFVARQGAAHGIDIHRLAVGGDSAGGNLAAAVALAARDQGGPALGFQLLIYPVVDLGMGSDSFRRHGQGYFLTRPMMGWFIDHYAAPADRADWRASPLLAASLAGLPPALVVTAGFDPLVDEGEAFAKRLREEGGLADYICYGGMIHGFFNMAGGVATANRAIAHAGAALHQALWDQDEPAGR